MSQFFNADLPRLKLFFLQFDRLLCIHSPDLHTHFSNQSITSSYFASAWFITLFTNQLANNTNSEMVVNESLLMLWDYFLVAGWKAMIKMSMYVCVMD